jgi:hypothetical protein
VERLGLPGVEETPWSEATAWRLKSEDARRATEQQRKRLEGEP